MACCRDEVSRPKSSSPAPEIVERCSAAGIDLRFRGADPEHKGGEGHYNDDLISMAGHFRLR
jgi:hypothetical protein